MTDKKYATQMKDVIVCPANEEMQIVMLSPCEMIIFNGLRRRQIWAEVFEKGREVSRQDPSRAGRRSLMVDHQPDHDLTV